MDSYLTIATNGQLYDLFYNLAFLFVFVILIAEGIKRQIPILKWIFLLLITRFLFISGTKIFTFSQYEWEYLFTNFQLPETNNKSLIGGLLLGGMGLLSGFYLFRFKKNVTDAFAFALPVGIAMQRIGCFFSGCCFGKISFLPWAVKYPVQSLPHYHQFNNGLIDTTNMLSLPVHPVQIYEVLGIIMILVLLFVFKKHFHKPGSLFEFSMVLLFVVRIGIEFFRDIHAHTIGGKLVGPFNTTQIFLFFILLCLLFHIYQREKQAKVARSSKSVTDLSLPLAFALLLGFALILQGTKNWFNLAELTAMFFVLLIASGILIYRILNRIYLSPYKWLYLAGSIFPVLLMAQTYRFATDSMYIKTYKSIKIGMGTGDFVNRRDIGEGSGCDRVSNTDYFKQNYTLISTGIEFARENTYEETRFKYGSDLALGKHTEIRLSDNYEIENNLFSISPYALFETNWMDIGGGLHLGNVRFIYTTKEETGTEIPKSGSKGISVYPRFYFRLGPERWFFADYSLAHNFPSALPGFRHQLGIGTGFGLRNGTRIRYGSDLGDFTYVSGYIPIKNRVVLQPMYLWGANGYSNYSTHKQFSMGLSYRFGYDKSKKSLFSSINPEP